MRFVLAIIAAIANAAGPWLCCCAVGAMLHGPVEAKSVVPIEPTTVETCTHCCPHEPAPTDESKPPKPNKSCPCQERMISIPAATPALTDPLTAIDGIAWDVAVPAVFVSMATTDTPTASRESERAFLPPDTRQRVHHVLHC